MRNCVLPKRGALTPDAVVGGCSRSH